MQAGQLGFYLAYLPTQSFQPACSIKTVLKQLADGIPECRRRVERLIGIPIFEQYVGVVAQRRGERPLEVAIKLQLRRRRSRCTLLDHLPRLQEKTNVIRFAPRLQAGAGACGVRRSIFTRAAAGVESGIDRSTTRKLMGIFTVYRDIADLLTIVSDDGRGWPSAYWSSALFVTDAWAISRRRKTELNRPTPDWARRLEWPEPIAQWSSTTGELVLLDEEPGNRAERYLGINFDPFRWASLDAKAFRVAVLAAASCRFTTAAATQALERATPHQIESFLRSDATTLRQHLDLDLRRAAERIGVPLLNRRRSSRRELLSR